MEIREIPSRTIRLARFSSSLFVMRERINKPPPMILPTVGKWFNKRWMCAKSIGDSQALTRLSLPSKARTEDEGRDTARLLYHLGFLKNNVTLQPHCGRYFFASF